MTTFGPSVLLTAALAMAASGQTAEVRNAQFEQWHKTKFGRYSPAEEKRREAEKAGTAYREDTKRPAANANATFEQWHKTKFGRSSPAEEQRVKAEQDSSAFRSGSPSPSRDSQADRDWTFEQWYKGKYGRTIAK